MAGLVSSLLVIALLVASASGHGGFYPTGHLSPSFYGKSCPNVRKIVKTTLSAALKMDPTYGASILRLYFADSFTNGLDASLLLEGAHGHPAEKDSPSNFGVRAFNVIDKIKAALEKACPATVSCADTLALATQYSVSKAGGPDIVMELGRKDGMVSTAAIATANLPGGSFIASQLIANFAAHGLDVTDLVALSGAHSIGDGHCGLFANRLAPNTDPTLNPAYGANLNKKCGAPKVVFNKTVDMDGTPMKVDNVYYKYLTQGKGLFTSDETLFGSPKTKGLVKKYATNQKAFFAQFANSMKKMGAWMVLTGSDGEIRLNCRKVNA